jgi:AcrR family transcriptional regulator
VPDFLMGSILRAAFISGLPTVGWQLKDGFTTQRLHGVLLWQTETSTSNGKGRTMEAYELLQEIYQQHSVKELAAQAGLSPSTLYKWAEAGEQHRLNPLEQITRLYHQTGDRRLLDWIVERSGGKFVLTQKEPATFPCPARQQLEGLSAAVAAELSAPWFPPQTAAHWRRSWRELQAETERRLARCGRACAKRQSCGLAARAFAFAAFLKASMAAPG